MAESGHKQTETPDSRVSDSQTKPRGGEEPHAAVPPNSSADASASEETGLIDLASQWVTTAGSRVKVMVELVLAEARLAAISVALMAFLAMLSAAFLLGAWGLLIAGLIYGLIQTGLPLWPIMFVLCGLHILIAYLAWRGAVKLSNNLEFPVTRQQFQHDEEEPDEVAKSTTQG